MMMKYHMSSMFYTLLIAFFTQCGHGVFEGEGVWGCCTCYSSSYLGTLSREGPKTKRLLGTLSREGPKNGKGGGINHQNHHVTRHGASCPYSSAKGAFWVKVLVTVGVRVHQTWTPMAHSHWC